MGQGGSTLKCVEETFSRIYVPITLFFPILSVEKAI